MDQFTFTESEREKTLGRNNVDITSNQRLLVSHIGQVRFRDYNQIQDHVEGLNYRCFPIMIHHPETCPQINHEYQIQSVR